MLNKNLPGPFTFVLEANKQVGKSFDYNRKTIGIRIPSDNISVLLPRQIGEPIVTTSIHHEDEVLQYETDPEVLFNRYQHQVDVILDASNGAQEGSTVVDATNEEPHIIRQGMGQLVL
jgi:tRNA threonylcarbamoyl adenosine modification protein (Sua5/YciO/YrdC/YwlC family)